MTNPAAPSPDAAPKERIAVKLAAQFDVTDVFESVICQCGMHFQGAGVEQVAQMRRDVAAHVCPPRATEPRTFWLSFCDSNKPKGQQFLGVCIVDVTPDEAEDARLDVMLNFPCAQEGAEWIAAATGKAHRLKCNPGGEVMAADITESLPFAPAPVPRDVLLSFADLERLGLQPARLDDENEDLSHG